MGELTFEKGSDEAVAIGMLYRRARSSHIEAVKFLLEAGRQLRSQKEALPHGQWLLWIDAHKHELGFGDWTASRLMRGWLDYSNSGLAQDLTDDSASALSRLIWRHEAEPSMYPAGPPVNYVQRVAKWADNHDWAEFDELDADERSALLESIARVQSRFAELQARLQQPLRRVA